MSAIAHFEERQVRRVWNAVEKNWHFATVDVIAVLTYSIDPGAYWRKLKERLKKEGNETVPNCHALKMTAADGRQRTAAVAAKPRSGDHSRPWLLPLRARFQHASSSRSFLSPTYLSREIRTSDISPLPYRQISLTLHPFFIK